MSEWTRPAQRIHCVVEMDKPLTMRRERWALVEGDKNANTIEAEVFQTTGKPFDLTGCTVTLTFVRPDKLAAPPIAAEVKGNVATATLTDACYRVSGRYHALMQIAKGGTDRTILWLVGDVLANESDGIVDEEGVFPTPEELLIIFQQVEQAKQAADAAASGANVAASSANTAASRANQAASAIENASASAETLATGQPATVSVNGMHFTFGLPRGEKGEKGEAGSVENVTITSIEGLPEALEGKQPKGDYLSADGTAVNAEKLGGKAPEYYIQPRNLLDNSWWKIQKEIVNQRGQTSYTGGYGIDRWQNSNSTITLTGDGLKLTKTDANDVSKFIGTILPENIRTNLVYTVAISINGVVETFNSAFPNTDGESYVIDGDTVSCEFGKAVSCYVIRFVFGRPGEHAMKWAALYEGEYTADTLPPYVPKGYAAELAECMRYFQKSGEVIIGTVSDDHGYYDAVFPLMIPMIRKPSITVWNDANLEGKMNIFVAGANWMTVDHSQRLTTNTMVSARGSGVTPNAAMCVAFKYEASADL